ncbi:MAG: hypothetical protein AB7E76_04070 [Deferribacterales bacterium]
MRYLLITALIILLQGCANYSMVRKADAVDAKFMIKDVGEVYLYTSANGYKKIKLNNDKDKWLGSFPFKEGTRYFLTVDGKMYLPECSMRENDGFGGQLCIYEEN